MSLRIRLRRMGRKKSPVYRIVVAEALMPRDGRYVENIGFYNPRTEPLTLQVDRDRALYWIGNGAKPSETVQTLLRRAGVFEEVSAVAGVTGAVTGAVSAAAGAVASAASNVAGRAGDAAGAVASAASNVAERAGDAVGSVASAVRGAVSKAAHAVEDAAGSVVDRVRGDDEAEGEGKDDAAAPAGDAA